MIGTRIGTKIGTTMVRTGLITDESKRLVIDTGKTGFLSRLCIKLERRRT
jgi:hypothetical protein